MQEDEVLKGVREEIDQLDLKLLELLKKRSNRVSEVAVIKKQHGLVAHQPERFEVMMKSLQTRAQELGVDSKLVNEIWNAIHSSSQNQQNKTLI